MKDVSMIVRSALAVAGTVLFTTMVVGFSPPTAQAQPGITEASPAPGDVLQTLPEFFHLCFSEPVKVEESSDWKFNVSTPDHRDLGLRIVFQTSGSCVDVFPGAPEEPPDGIWTFDWLVHAQSDGSEGSGTINFQLGELQPGETPLMTPDPGAGTGQSDGDDGVPLGLYVAAGVGVAVIVAAGAGFVLSRRRRA